MAPADPHALVTVEPAAAGPAPARGGEIDVIDAEGYAHPHACANCRTPLVGAYCHACGQPAHVHRTAVALLHDIGHGVFHFEGAVWRTLPRLLWRPGELTRRYVAGERARFVSPMALYLFCVFVMFTVLGLGGHHDDQRWRSVAGGAAPAPTVRATPTPVAAPSSAAVSAPPATSPAVGTKTSTKPEDRLVVAGNGAFLNGRRVTGDQAARLALGDVQTGIPRVDAALHRFYDDPEFAFYKLKSSAYKYSWVLIPLSLPFVWLLFPFSRRFGLYDHAIFVTYSLSFVTLLLVTLTGLGWLGLPDDPLMLGALILIPTHMYRQLRGAYDLGRAGAAWRLAVLVVFVAIVLGLFGLLLAWLGLF